MDNLLIHKYRGIIFYKIAETCHNLAYSTSINKYRFKTFLHKIIGIDYLGIYQYNREHRWKDPCV